MAKNKHKYRYSPFTLQYKDVLGNIHHSINKGLHNRDDEIATNLIPISKNNERNSAIYNRKKPRNRTEDEEAKEIVKQSATNKYARKRVLLLEAERKRIQKKLDKEFVKQLKEIENSILKEYTKERKAAEKQASKEYVAKLRQAEKELLAQYHKKKEEELKPLRDKVKGVLKRAEKADKLDLYKDIYGENINVKEIIQSVEDFDNFDMVRKEINSLKRKENKIEELKVHVYNDEKTPDEKIKQIEKDKEKQQKKIDEIKQEIIDLRKEQKNEAIKNSNVDSVTQYKHDTQDEDLYKRVKNIDNSEELNTILENLKSKTLATKLAEKTEKDVYTFLTTKYFNQILLDRTRDKNGELHELNVQQRIEKLSKSFGSNYAMAQDFLNYIVSAEFRGDYDSDGGKKSDVLGFKHEMQDRLERAEMRVAQLLHYNK